jgi:GTP cyclohydrolase IA
MALDIITSHGPAEHLDDDGAESIGIAPIIKEMLLKIGEDPDREGLLKTPSRVDKAIAFLTSGYRADIDKIVNGAVFEEGFDRESDEVVLVRDLEFYSMCEHHMIPFFGTAHVAYMPSRKIIGLSKIPRLLDVFARRLQVQERMTKQLADCLHDVLQPKGVAVVVEAKHMCMCMRGVQKQNSTTLTTAMVGVYKDNPQYRAEFMSLIRGTQAR